MKSVNKFGYKIAARTFATGASTPPIPPRDLNGYGKQRPQFSWPKNAKVAVIFNIQVDEGAEDSVEDGCGRNDTNSEMGAMPIASWMPDGRRDLAMEQMVNYGLRSGIWRILDGFDKANLPFTSFVCGRTAERVPQVIKSISQAGHEVAFQSFRWKSHTFYSNADEEKIPIMKSLDAVMTATGVKPKGFMCKWSPSPYTARICAELGLDYFANAFDDEIPYYIPFLDGSKPILAVPSSLDANDFKFFVNDPWGTGESFYQYLDQSLQVLLEEGANGKPGVMSIGLRPRISGRPGRWFGVKKFLNRLTSLGNDVWVTRHLDLAQEWKSNFPPPKVTVPPAPPSASTNPP